MLIGRIACSLILPNYAPPQEDSLRLLHSTPYQASSARYLRRYLPSLPQGESKH